MSPTKQVEELLDRHYITKSKLANDLDITRPTLEKKMIGEVRWKKLEISHIKRMAILYKIITVE